MWRNVTDRPTERAEQLYPLRIDVVSTAALPEGLAIRLDPGRGQVRLLDAGDARLVAAGLLEAAGELERSART